MQLQEDITIELGRQRDAFSMAEMSRDLIERGLGWSWQCARIVRQIRHPDVQVVVARDGWRILGFAIMQFRDDTAHLNLFAVARSYQRRGIGRSLLQWLECTARTAGVFLVNLEVRENNATARSFYRSLGYIEMLRIPRYYRGTESAVRMYHDLHIS
ncbi:MAG: GNAT family N-acetyltransferase [Gammaproteobacteria bacterium]|nr:GNAT family N-acetyltransferase [Gammaproteobacteria bacterium]